MTTSEQLIDRLGVVLEELLATNKHMLATLRIMAERSGSSVEIDSNGRAGETKIKIKEYAGSEPPVADAIANYTAAMQAAAEGHMKGWAETLEALGGGPKAA